MKPKVLTLILLAAAASSAAGAPPATKAPRTAHPGKLMLCHLTGSKQHPYVLVTISAHAQGVHLGLGDVVPGASGKCPTTAPAAAGPKGDDGRDDDSAAPGTDD